MNSGQKVYFQVVEYIKELVKTGQVEVGGRLPSERELMERLGLSRNSIREALRTLENMGIIESRQGKGNYLANNMGRSLSGVFSTLLLMKETSYLEVSQLRHAMEMQAFYMAADQIGPGEKQEFEEIIGRMRHPDVQEKNRADHQFHQMLIRCSGNRLLQVVMDALSEVCREEIAMMRADSARDDEEKWRKLHEKIYHCLVARDLKNGMKAIMEHYAWVDRGLREIGESGRNG